MDSEFERATYDLLEARSILELSKRQILKTEAILELLRSQYSNDQLELEVLLREELKLLNFKKNQVRAETKEHSAIARIAYLKSDSNEVD